MFSWKHHPPIDAFSYDRMRRRLVEAAGGSTDGWSSLDYIGSVREGWDCNEFRGLSIHKVQTNPEAPVSRAQWAFAARHFINTPDDQQLEEIARADTLDAAKKAAEAYALAHIGFAFTTRFRNDYDHADTDGGLN
jgi:hypothetical protein